MSTYRSDEPTNWVRDGEGPEPNGTPGGDGAGESSSVSWVHKNGRAQITVDWYSVDTRISKGDDDIAESDRWDVECQTAYELFDSSRAFRDREPWWSDITYENLFDIGPESEAQAEVWALNGARNDFAGRFIERIDWDGVSIPNLHGGRVESFAVIDEGTEKK